LAAVAYGVYTTLNRSAQTPATPPPGGWPEGPPQEMPDLASFTPKLGDPETGEDGSGGVPPVGASSGVPDVSVGVPSVEAASAGAYGSGSPDGEAPPAPNYGIGQAAPGANGNGPGGAAPAFDGGAAPPADRTSSAAPAGGAPQYPSTDGAHGPSPYDTSASSPGSAEPSDPGPALPADPGAASTAEQVAENDASSQFDDLMQAVQRELDAGRLAEAHLALSRLHDNPKLPVEMRERVVDLLDQLAGEVIYSREHHLEPAYTVRPGDTIESIAAQYDVPAAVLARINGVDPQQELQPGRELKVIRGPFSAEIDLDEYELTLMLGRRYAGRFPIGVGQDHANLEGTYTVRHKMTDPPYNSPDGAIPPGAPSNPLGRYYIDLGNYVGIHGTNNTRDLHRTAGRGAIRLGDRDINDLYGILSVGSEVVIRR